MNDIHDKDGGRVGKRKAGRRNGRKSRVNGDNDVKMFWGTCFECWEKGQKEDYCPIVR